MSDNPLLELDLAPVAKASDAKVKLFAWGGPGTKKTRTALSFPNPLVADLERGTMHYAAEFTFRRAVPGMVKGKDGKMVDLKPVQLVDLLVDQIKAGHYPDVETLVIDPLTLYLEHLEAGLMKAMGIDLNNLSGMARAQAYHRLNEAIRKRLEAMLALPIHIVWLAREKTNWVTQGAKVVAEGVTYDAKPEAEYLADVVLQMTKDGARTIKSRLKPMAQMVSIQTFDDLRKAMEDGIPQEEEGAPELEAEDAIFDLDTPMATPEQLQQLGIECGRLFGSGEANEARAKEWISQQVGREIVSRKALTKAEAERLLRTMRGAKSLDALMAKVGVA